MKNRIASLFALDTLLGGTTNGHGPATHPPEHRKKQKGRNAVRRGPKQIETQRGVKSVDKGDPIRCQHDVAYKPVAPVDVEKPPGQTPSTTPIAQQLGDEYDVEAFEEPDEEDMTPRLADEDEYERLETASGMPWRRATGTPEEDAEPVTAQGAVVPQAAHVRRRDDGGGAGPRRPCRARHAAAACRDDARAIGLRRFDRGADSDSGAHAETVRSRRVRPDGAGHGIRHRVPVAACAVDAGLLGARPAARRRSTQAQLHPRAGGRFPRAG
jgi:hypothetical protein